MTSFLKTLIGLLLRTVLLLMGLVFLLSLLAAALVLLAFWVLRALWARLTGRPVQPLAFAVLRRAQWQRFYRPAAAQAARDADVIDVESRQVGPDPHDKLGR
ncbi:MAG: hypothetical protein Q8R72_09445 [Hylemonella sp.]|nr:hypothetical protein [Hylemonella sp.]